MKKDEVFFEYPKFENIREIVEKAERENPDNTAFIIKNKDEPVCLLLEKFRIEKACELLKGDMKITDIPKEVGYNSDMSFRRAFKKVYGVTPSGMRESAK